MALYAEMVVREDLIQLIGFRTLAEREWWRLLVTVQGVGAKAALAILGTLGAEGVARALSLGDVSAVRAAPGVGPKLAQRVVLELKAKAPAVMALGAAGSRPATVAGTPATLPERAPAAAPAAPVAAPAPAAGAQDRADALSALVNLGYGEGEAAAAVAGAEGDGRGGADPGGAAGAGAEGMRRWQPIRRCRAGRCPRTSTGRSGRRRSPSSSARRRRGRTSRCSSRARGGAGRRWTTRCSTGRRGSARPRWRRSWRASSG